MQSDLCGAHLYEGLGAFLVRERPAIDEAVLRYLPLVSATQDGPLHQAIRFALFPGGKRLRPALALLGAELAGQKSDLTYLAAAVVEYVHTSSLILDDLPCMDNAAERRGRPCLHMVHGEALSVLAAVALLNASYGMILKGFNRDIELATRAHAELVACIGPDGMVTGQAVDLFGGQNRAADDGQPDGYNLKTSALLRLALRLGAMTAGATSRQLAALSRYSVLLGELYQLGDDLQDRDEDCRNPVTASPKDCEARAASLKRRSRAIITGEFGDSPAARLLNQLTDYCSERARSEPVRSTRSESVWSTRLEYKL